MTLLLTLCKNSLVLGHNFPVWDYKYGLSLHSQGTEKGMEEIWGMLLQLCTFLLQGKWNSKLTHEETINSLSLWARNETAKP